MGKSRFRCFLFEKYLTFYNSDAVHGKDKACAQPEGPEDVIPGAKSNNDDDIVQGVLFNWSSPKSFELKLHIWSMTHLCFHFFGIFPSSALFGRDQLKLLLIINRMEVDAWAMVTTSMVSIFIKQSQIINLER